MGRVASCYITGIVMRSWSEIIQISTLKCYLSHSCIIVFTCLNSMFSEIKTDCSWLRRPFSLLIYYGIMQGCLWGEGNVPCLNIVLSKILGIWIMLGTVVVNLPQIYKLLRVGSAEGLSFASTLLELFAITGSLVYCISLNFPIGAWGETLFIVIQNLTIGFLIQHFGGSTLRGVGFILIYCCLLSLLISPLTPRSVVMVMQSSYMPAVIIAQLIQLGINYHNRHTGQLSAVSVFLLFFGSLARIYAQKTGDSLMILTCVLASCCNAVTAGQVLCYWNRRASVKEKKE